MSGKLPETRREMERALYVFKGLSQCKSCGAPIEWWLTTNKKSMPFDVPTAHLPEALDEQAVVHWATCPNSKQHKAKDAPAAQRFQAVQRIAQQLGARLVVVLDEDGYSYAAKQGLDPEEVRHELITAANEIRREIGAHR